MKMLNFLHGYVCFTLCAVSTGNSADANGPAATNSLTRPKRQPRNIDSSGARKHPGEYVKHGRKNPIWDDDAKNALDAYAFVYAAKRMDGAHTERLTNSLKTAVSKGCDDPLIRYLHLRYVSHPELQSREANAETFRSIAKSMGASEYSALRKFYVALRAAEHFKPKGPSLSPESAQFLRRQKGSLPKALRDKTLPISEGL